MRRFLQDVSAATEFLVVLLLSLGYFVLGSLLSLLYPDPRETISSSDLYFLIGYETFLLLLLGWFLRLRGWSFARLGLSFRPGDVPAGVGIAVVAYLGYVGFFLAGGIVSPGLLRDAALAVPVAPDIGLPTIFVVSLLNPVFEEVFVCAYVVSSLRDSRSFWFAVNTSIALRLSYHLYQGPVGIVSIVPFGFLFAYWYARTGRLWPMIIAHAMYDMLGLMNFR